MKNLDFFKSFIYDLSDPDKTLDGLDDFIEDYKDALFWYGHIGIPDDKIDEIVLNEEPLFMDNADFFSDAIDVFGMLRRRGIVSKSLQEHEKSIDYFKERVAPYL
ncbi:hypothetical protein CL621_03465 [archaeon]|nr:hypothetical protein [archaeon]|tara:strand:- start:776 stop:1090 length:315 start_codon:yes stop_codon:yes gene_type:complete